MSKRKALPRGFGLWPMPLILKWLDANGYKKEAEDIRKETIRERRSTTSD